MNQTTLKRLKTVLRYDPSTGLFVWLQSRGKAKAGAIAGYTRPDKYVEIRIDGVCHLAHRLAWFYMTGEWPAEQVDHRDTMGSNNRWLNLRSATPTFNQQNQRRAQRNNRSGFLGVTYRPKIDLFEARIRVNRRLRSLGRFPTGEEAHAAYVAAKRVLHEGGTL